MDACTESAVDRSLNGNLVKTRMRLPNQFSRHSLATGTAVVLGIAVAWVIPIVPGISITWADPPSIEQLPTVLIHDDPSLQMRAKLDRSKQVLDSVIRQDFDSISRAARELKRIASATDWPMEGDSEFERYRAMFSAQCDDLDRLAKGVNSHGIQMTFLAMTETCIRCHDHIRDTRSADQAARTGDVRLFPARSSAGTFRQ